MVMRHGPMEQIRQQVPDSPKPQWGVWFLTRCCQESAPTLLPFSSRELVAFFWLVLLVVFLIAEAACPIHLVSIWFALGALVALLCAALGAPVWLQITLFVVVSGVLLALLWPLAKKFLNSKVTATNVDSVVGSVGRVTADIDNVEARGQVKLGGMEWTARSTSGDPISVGTEVRVDRVEGVKVYVTPVEAAVTV